MSNVAAYIIDASNIICVMNDYTNGVKDHEQQKIKINLTALFRLSNAKNLYFISRGCLWQKLDMLSSLSTKWEARRQKTKCSQKWEYKYNF